MKETTKESKHKYIQQSERKKDITKERKTNELNKYRMEGSDKRNKYIHTERTK